MNEDLRQLYRNFNQRPTEELLEIWRGNNHTEYTDLSFQIIQGILRYRHIDIMSQNEAITIKEENSNSEFHNSENMSVLHILFSLKGRVGLETFWLVTAFIIIFMVILSIVDNVFFKFTDESGLLQLFGMVIILWPSLAITVKRWHDRDKSGLWCAFGLVPIVGQIWGLIELGFLSGTNGPNLYGKKGF